VPNPIKVNLTEPQERFLLSTAPYPAFVAGFGAGKSEVLAISALGDAAHSSSALIGMYAPTYDLVRLITAPRICEKLSEHGIPHRWNKQDNIVYTSWPRFGDFVMRTMDNPDRIVGYETYRAHVDEIDTLKTENARRAWNQIIARNRQRPEGIQNVVNRASAYTTPEGFRFVYDRWVRNKAAGYEIIQAPTYSNPFLPASYLENLRASYSPELIEAYIEGRFVNLTSGTVYSSFDRAQNGSTETIIGKTETTPGELLRIGMDFNVGNMACAVYVKRDNGWHLVGEIVEGLDTPSVIDTLKDRYKGHQMIIYPDASGKNTSSKGASLSDIGMLRQAGFTVRAKNSNPRVKDRVAAVNRAFSTQKVWVNAHAAPETARCLEQQAYNKNGEPDKQSGLDHSNDAAGYPIAYEMPVVRQTFTAQELRI